MEISPTDQIRFHLNRYEESINRVDRHFDRISGSGPDGSASEPYMERNRIQHLLSACNNDTLRSADLLKEYERITGKLVQLEKSRGQEYRNLLHVDLRCCLDQYHAAVCHARLSNLCPESEDECLCRDQLAVLVEELKKDFDLSGIEQMIGMLDTGRMSIPASNGQKMTPVSTDTRSPVSSGSRRGILSE